MKGKHGRYLRYGVYLLMVFLFLFAAYSFPRFGEKKKEMELPVPMEDNISPQEEKVVENTEESRIPRTQPQLFLGVHDGRIAIFARDDSGKISLEEVLPYSVKKVYYEELLRGIPFSTEEEMNLLLENFTS